jgi:multidrug efflux pump subunit AcrA (membrane-fusion protein)
VPIYGGEVASIAENEPARVSGLGETDAAKAISAEPVQAPPTADPQAATVDLYYSLANTDGRLRPGQRLNVSLALREQEESIVIPYSAIEYDPSSGAWVYAMTAPQTYVRRRVQLAFVDGDLAVIEKGPGEGEHIVSVAAAELWGTEFGAGH